MGFWGTMIVHKGEPLLAQLLPDIEEFHEAELDYDRVNGAWQVSRVYRAGLEDLPPDLLTRLRDATGAPVIAAQVFDSDGAFVHGVGARVEFKAWLQLEWALGYLLTPYTIDGDDSEYARENDELRASILAETPGGAVAAAAAIEWAHEAGLTPAGLDEVTAVLDGGSVFAEEQFVKLLNSLGLDTAAVALPTPLAPFDVLRERCGHRLEGVDRVPHPPDRRRLVQPGAADLRLRFEGLSPVVLCSCTEWTLFLPDAEGEGESFGEPFVHVLGQPLTAAASLAKGPPFCGLALRFGDMAIWLALVDGDWVTSEEALKSRGYEVLPWSTDEFAGPSA